ncbi:MAG TPA: hypothetical protein VHO90_07415, partial [Bacteroidales bacterium]|nr:hypothetical protein [Bacteroidales bacterium]
TVYNRTYISNVDTVLYISSSIPYKLEKRQAGNFYDRIDSGAQYSRLTRELRNILLTHNRPNVSIDKESTEKSEANFTPHQNKIIRNISFEQLNAFGPTVNDTAHYPLNWIERTGNKLHFKTKEYLLRNNLIIKEGEPLDPLKLADNERLLREAPYLHDAKIFVKETTPESDSVDIYIVVKDVWSTAFDLKLDNLYGGNFSLWDKNIFGFGHEIENTMYWNGKESPNLGYEGAYSVPNIGGTFIRGKTFYLNKFGNETYGLSFDRDFYTPNIKYAGGLSITRTTKLDNFSYPDTTIVHPVGYTKSDFWLGRSLPLPNYNLKSRKNISLTFRMTNTYITQRPSLTETQFYNYHNRTLYLSSLTFTNQSYYKSNLIYNFGRTEDIPYGLKLEITGGFETNEFKNRSFAGARVDWATFMQKLGYLYLNAGHEGFTNEDKKVEQGVFYAQMRYFTPLLKYRKMKFRHFIDINYTKGVNRYQDEYLTINDKYGLNGLINDSIRGNERFNMRFESVCFSPFYFYEFRFVFFSSVDFSLFGKNKDVWSNKLYSGLSFGVRIRNERLVFNTLELRFHIYPNKPPYSDTSFITLSGEKSLSPPSFRTRAPELAAFQ